MTTRPSSLALAWRYVQPRVGAITLLLGLLGASIALQLAGPQIVRGFIDAATHQTPPEQLRNLALLFILLALFQQVFAVLATYVGERVGWSATNALREDLMRHCLRLDLTFHKARTPGELIERIDGDVTALANFFSQFIVQIVGNVLLLAGVTMLLWLVNWRAGLLLIVFGAATTTVMLWARNITVPYWRQARQASADLFGFLEERLGGTVDIRSSGASAYMVRQLHVPLRARILTNCKARVIGVLNWGPLDLLLSLQFGASFVVTYLLYRAGLITIGTGVMIYSYMWLSARPMREIRHQLEDFQKAAAGLIRVQDLLAERSTLLDPAQPKALPDGPLAVRFDGVTFAYEAAGTPNASATAEVNGLAGGPEETVLCEVSFTVPAGQVLGLLGRTGSGKTTISRLLFRLYDLSGGTITLNGTDLRQVRRQELRQRVGMVTQDVQVFRASVRDNVTFFDRTVPEARVREALEGLGLGEWLARLPDGLETVLGAGHSGQAGGARGAGVSAGEAQLLAFARVFLKDPGLVILDEASSRLDPATERQIERAIDRLLTGRTGIVIAHRLATIARADWVLILDEGRVAEFGPRAALAADPGSRLSELLRTGLEAAEAVTVGVPNAAAPMEVR